MELDLKAELIELRVGLGGVQKRLLRQSEGAGGSEEPAAASGKALMAALVPLMKRGTGVMRELLSRARRLHGMGAAEETAGYRTARAEIYRQSQEFRAWLERFLAAYTAAGAIEEKDILASVGAGEAREGHGQEETPSIDERLLRSHREGLSSTEGSLRRAAESLSRAVQAFEADSAPLPAPPHHHSHSHSQGHGHGHGHRRGHLSLDDELEHDGEDNSPQGIARQSLVLYGILAVFLLYAIAEFIVL